LSYEAFTATWDGQGTCQTSAALLCGWHQECEVTAGVRGRTEWEGMAEGKT